ncbi:MAG: glutaredoxin family protein [Chloroflexota bacterium]
MARTSHTAMLYTKEGCCLCGRARELLHRLQREFDLRIEEVDILQDPALEEQYRYIIPVVVIDGRHRFEPNKIAEHYIRRVLEPAGVEMWRWPWQR